MHWPKSGAMGPYSTLLPFVLYAGPKRSLLTSVPGHLVYHLRLYGMRQDDYNPRDNSQFVVQDPSLEAIRSGLYVETTASEATASSYPLLKYLCVRTPLTRYDDCITEPLSERPSSTFSRCPCLQGITPFVF